MERKVIMARPKKEIVPVKNHAFVVRLDDVQYSVIAGYAKQLGMSMAEYIRYHAVHGKVEIKYPVVAALPELQKLTDEFSAIGNNLNQIARYFNMGGLQSKAMREEINECMGKIMEMREAVMGMAGDLHGSAETPVE